MKFTRLPVALATLLTVVACSKQEPAPSASGQPVAAVAQLAVSGGLPAKLCKVLEKIAPEVRQMPPVGAQAQLVMAVAAAFDNNPESLRQVSAEIDVIAAGSCAAARESLLSVLKMKSLQEAVR